MNPLAKKTTTGSLYIVATPIGNKADITLRAIEVLSKVNLIAAEDTRHSQLLLSHYQIKTPCISLHDFNEHARLEVLLERLRQGEDVALISDAGTPLISDPGYLLVQTVRKASLTIIPIPGPSAVITALSASGLPTNSFTFIGFLSAKDAHRRQQLRELLHETRTVIFYESPHRIVKFCQDLQTVFPADRQMVLAKELTKTFETFINGTAEDILKWLNADNVHQKGEFVILVQGAEEKSSTENTLPTQRVLEILLAELPPKTGYFASLTVNGRKEKLFI